MVLGVLMALAFAVMNGVNDAAAVVAMPVVTRVARPLPAIVLAVAGNLLGPLLLGTAVAGVIAGIVRCRAPRASPSWAPASPARWRGAASAGGGASRPAPARPSSAG